MLGGPEIVSIYIGATESQPISTNLTVLLTLCDGRNVPKESWLTHETAKCHPMSKRNLGSFLCQTADVHSIS